MTRISTFAFALTALFAFNGAQAAISLPIAEAGFALASNGGADTIATPMSNDQGGGTMHPSEAAVETPDHDTSHSEAAGGSSICSSARPIQPTCRCFSVTRERYVRAMRS